MTPTTPQAPQHAALLKPGDLVDENDAAARLDVAPRTLRNWRSKKTGPKFCKIGKRIVRYRVADLDAFVDNCVSEEGAA